MQIFKWYDEQNSKAQTNNINISNHFFEWVLLYSHVADFALRKTSFEGSYLCAGSVLASFMVKILERVPFRSRLGQKAVLFLRTIEEYSLSCCIGVRNK